MVRIWKLLVVLCLRKSNSFLEDLKRALTYLTSDIFLAQANHPEADITVFS